MESKYTTKKSIRVTRETLDKISREARAEGRLPMLVLGFEDGERWFAVPAAAFPETEE